MGRHALLLGTVTCHADRQLQPLPSVRQDVAQLKAVLDGSGKFDTVRAELDLPAAHLRQIVEEFYGVRRYGDMALLYYSGHGVMHDDRQSLFLAAADTIAGQPHATALDVDGALRHLLNITKASQKVVLLDCCFSGAFTARNRFTGGVRQEPRRGKRERGTFILTSSTHMKASKAQDSDRPSVFTEVLLDGLRGAAEGTADDGWITTNDLSRYAMTEMARRRQHTPVESSEGVTEPIRLVAAPQSEDATGRAATIVATPADDAPFDVDQWRRLIDYYVNCLRRSAALQALIDPHRSTTYVPAPGGAEAVYTALTPVRLHGQMAQLAVKAREQGKELQYGYPVVAVRPGKRQPVRLAPLLVCDASVGSDDLLHASFPPRPSSALIDLCGLSEVEADELAQCVAEVFVPGDRNALVATVDLLLRTFSLTPVVDLEPAALAETVRPAPLDRVQNAALLYIADPVQQGLADDLQELIKNPKLIEQTALGALAARMTNASSTPVVTVAFSPINEPQEEVIQAAMSQRLTVAQGPPGTGKSQLVTALLATATAAGQSVLIGSNGNEAVDSVAGKADKVIGPGLLLRSGNKEHRSREPKHLADILTAYPPAEQGVAPDTRTPLHELRLLAGEEADLREVLNERRRLERDLADLATERRNESGDGPALPEDDQALAQLVHLTDRALQSRLFGWWYRRRLRPYGVAGRDAIAFLAERAVLELRWRDGRRRLTGLADAEQVWRRLVELVETRRPACSIQLLHSQIAHRVAVGAQLLRDRADEMAKPKHRSWAYFPKLLTVLPGWAVTTLSARRLPPTSALYDLVIIDEAAQCTVPEVLPMLYRAKRALIIGDPRQLAPIIELSETDDTVEQKKAGLGAGWLANRRLAYSRHSAYDPFAAAAGAVYLLDQHYRCHPEIVDVPNREVYQGQLTVLTDPRRLAAPAEPAVRWRHVVGEFSKGSTGSGWNECEITEVVAEVAQLRATYPDASIGVVTPLAAHRRALDAALRRAGLHNNLLCATIHKFQGSERDIMVVSPVGAHGIPDRTRDWLVHQTNLWNVAITRARSQLVVVGDRSWWSGQRGILTTLAVGSGSPQAEPDATLGPADQLHAAFGELDLVVQRDATVAGYAVDLVVRRAGTAMAILVDDPAGDPDGRTLRKMLARLDIVGSHMVARRAPAWRCLAEPKQIAAELSAYLHRPDETVSVARPSSGSA